MRLAAAFADSLVFRIRFAFYFMRQGDAMHPCGCGTRDLPGNRTRGCVRFVSPICHRVHGDTVSVTPLLQLYGATTTIYKYLHQKNLPLYRDISLTMHVFLRIS